MINQEIIITYIEKQIEKLQKDIANTWIIQSDIDISIENWKKIEKDRSQMMILKDKLDDIFQILNGNKYEIKFNGY